MGTHSIRRYAQGGTRFFFFFYLREAGKWIHYLHALSTYLHALSTF